MSERAPSQSRFFIRQGAKGWMVYDRERRGPALIGAEWASDLTMAQAERVKQMLISQPDGEGLTLSRGFIWRTV
ncbi:hypothetical protein BSZ19_26830 [Bradyrhizobium japonicum]|uniref:Uncharacterized protein n=1 Tax=Bradyrhizobium japonicum TaxID=375 RepID=A0A1Y2JJF9_BRAJP|nr:hypothetical protein BSZ19_26830 [Bradyrhizobium japonicum]